jgi:hypothetical protein
MDFTYTYGASDVSHTKAKAGDTDRWAASLSPLLDVNKSISMSHRELIKMDTTVLDIEMKKASVIRSELEVSAFFSISFSPFSVSASYHLLPVWLLSCRCWYVPPKGAFVASYTQSA